MTPIPRIATLSAIVALGLASSSRAQPPAPDSHRGAGPMAAEMKAMHEEHDRQRAVDLRTILRLRPDQEGALSAFLQSHRSPIGPEGRYEPPPATSMTTPQRLDEMARRDAEHAALRQQHAAALRTLYAALSPEQRQVFDALERLRGRGGPGGEGHHRFGGPMRRHGPMGGPPPSGH